jgi:DNA integrity scanning protein DisA with diadenylate cyclase activity
MAEVKNEAKVVEEKSVDEKVSNVIDVFWDGFFNSFKTFQSFQNGVEEKSLEAFEKQLELFESTFKQLINFEQESKKLTAEWKVNLQEAVTNTLTGYGVQNLTEWTDKFEEFEQKVESLTFNPSEKAFKVLSESQTQLESALKEAIEQRQQDRAEVLDVIDEYVDQLKQTQINVLKTLKLNNSLLIK